MEIPFGENHLRDKMGQYCAVLALSSPAHIKSKTSSSRVFEGIAAGVPVISDKNPHVIKLFGDAVYYLDGGGDKEKSENIEAIIHEINSNPDNAREKVEKAKELIKENYSFDQCLKNNIGIHYQIREKLHKEKYTKAVGSCQVFLFHHESINQNVKIQDVNYENLEHCLRALEEVAACDTEAVLTIVYSESAALNGLKNSIQEFTERKAKVKIDYVSITDLGIPEWNEAKFIEKFAAMAKHSHADFIYLF